MIEELTNLPTTRKEAIESGSMWFYTGKPCKHGHYSKRRTVQPNCWECERGRSKQLARRSRERNRARYREHAIKYYEDNKESVLARQIQYQKEKPHYGRAAVAQRRARKKQATLIPNDPRITTLYEKAKEWSVILGVELHVDHVIPLSKGGAHVWENLQLLEASLNRIKHASIPFTEYEE